MQHTINHLCTATGSSNNWNPSSATFYTTQGVPAELGFQRRNGNYLYMDPTSQDIGKYAHIRNWPGDLLQTVDAENSFT